jgi:hypothetical protein
VDYFAAQRRHHPPTRVDAEGPNFSFMELRVTAEHAERRMNDVLGATRRAKKIPRPVVTEGEKVEEQQSPTRPTLFHVRPYEQRSIYIAPLLLDHDHQVGQELYPNLVASKAVPVPGNLVNRGLGEIQPFEDDDQLRRGECPHTLNDVRRRRGQEPTKS